MINTQSLISENKALKKEVARLRELNQKLYSDQSKHAVRDAERKDKACVCNGSHLIQSTAGPKGKKQCTQCAGWN